MAKETINKMKRQPTEWEKIFANNATNKGLISNIYKHLIQLNIKKISWDKQKWKHNIPKLRGCSKSSSKREVYNDKHLH